MRPSLSVVIPTHDTRDLTLACLRALAPELPDDVEVIVVDDGGSDDTAAAVAVAHPSVHVVRLAPARGFTGAVNVGVAHAQGRLLLLLNSDTEVAPGALAALRAAFARAPRLGVAGASLRSPDGTPQWSGGPFPTTPWLFALASGVAAAAACVPGWRRVKPVAGHRHGRCSEAPLARRRAEAERRATSMPVAWVSGAALAVRADVWRAVGPLDERFALYAQDLDLCRRVRAAGFDVAVVPDAEVLHRGGATIGRLAGATSRAVEPALLWGDLLCAIEKHEGAEAVRRARRAVRIGAACRIVARVLAMPFVGAAHRATWRRDTAAYARASARLATSAYTRPSRPAIAAGS